MKRNSSIRNGRVIPRLLWLQITMPILLIITGLLGAIAITFIGYAAYKLIIELVKFM